MDKVLVIGGAGFIGSWTVDLLVKRGYEVTILDNLVNIIHEGKIPDYLRRDVKFVRGDVRNSELLSKLISESDAIIHLAALVGVGQSMYKVGEYVSVNTQGTAVLWDRLINQEHDVRKVIVASSMSIYGEGKYYCDRCEEEIFPDLRNEKQLIRREWDIRCPICNSVLRPIPTNETKPLNPTSVYAQTKRHQEELSLLLGKTYGIPTVALRYFNVYGPRQSLKNPYTGVMAIFSCRILNEKSPYIFEDGKQIRDFIYVEDVAEANVTALEKSGADYKAINIGSGKPINIINVANALIKVYGKDGKIIPYISQRYRKGDIRHIYADITLAKNSLNWKPKTKFVDGMKKLAKWAIENKWYAVDLFEKAFTELREKKLII